MKYRRLGKTDLRVSVVGFGAWQLGGEWGKEFTVAEVAGLLRRSQERGINLIDTAECYGDHLSERLIGEVIEKERDRWIVATKFGHKFHQRFERSDHWSADEVVGQLEDSLRSLRTDYVDLYQFHSGSQKVFDNDELWAVLQKQKEKGKIRHLGISIGSNDDLYQTDASTRVGAEAIQVVYNRLETAPEKRVFPSCEKQNLGVLARVPLASGFLSGKFKLGDEKNFTPDDVRGHWWKPEGIVDTIQKVDEIKKNEVPPGVDMASWALAWCLKQPAVTCVIPGIKTLAQVDSNAGAAALDLVRDDHPHALKRES